MCLWARPTVHTHGPEISFPQVVVGYALLEDPRVLDLGTKDSRVGSNPGSV